MYVNDFLGSAKVGMMSTEEIGAYLMLLFLDWQEGGFVNDPKRLAKWCRLSLPAFRRTWEQVGECFVERDGRMWNPRLSVEREKQESWRKKAAKGAAITNEKRRNGARPSDAIANANTNAERGENERIPFPSPLQTPVRALSGAPLNGDDAWDTVVGLIPSWQRREITADRHAEFSDGTKRGLSKIGGFAAIVGTPADKIVWLRKEFIAAYNG